ncbi:MAG: NAD(P)/FAD-dependent oxidoreductase [Marmoricola sp.]
MSCQVVVVGAGLAGLACATRLAAAGLEVSVLEASDGVGGRVRSDRVDGFTIDRGFQVLNFAYPEARRVLDYPALTLRPFERAVEVAHDGEVFRLAEPWRDPSTTLAPLTAPLGGPAQRLSLASYAASATLLPAARVKRRPDVPTARDLERSGVTGPALEMLMRPFFAGVLLEAELDTSSRFVRLMTRMFALDAAGVPSGGMQRIPEQLAGRLPAGAVRLDTPVVAVGAGRVEHGGGSDAAEVVVVATDGDAAAPLLPGVVDPPRWHGVRTFWHAMPEPPSRHATLRLAGPGSPILNSVVVSAAAPTYAPSGRSLVATSVLAGPGDTPPTEAALRPLLDRHWGTSTSSWETVAVSEVPRALPAMPAPHPFRRPVRVREGLYVCGDHRDTSSIQGALVSGRRTAEAVLEDRG